MRKPVEPLSVQGEKPARTARFANGKSRLMPEDDVTITSGSAGPRIDVSRWLDAARGGSLPGSLPGGLARAVPGGAQAATVGPSQVRTVALSDGSRITFAAARTPQELEPA
jgi:hypothetical protein